MLNSEFENKVRQQMEELKLDPGENVWDQIERKLPREEKRRRWLPYAVLFVLLSAGCFLLLSKTGQWNKQISVDKTSMGPDNSKAGSTRTVGTSDSVASKNAVVPLTANENPNLATSSKASLASAKKDEPGIANSESGVTASNKRTLGVYQPQGNTKAGLATSTATAGDQFSALTSSSPGANKKVSGTTGDNIIRLQRLSNHAIPMMTYASTYVPPDSIFATNRIMEKDLTTHPTRIIDSANTFSPSALVKRSTPGKWKANLIAGGGISSVVSGLFTSKNVLADNLGNSSGGVNVPGTGSGAVLLPNEPVPSAAFTTGVQVEKALGRRWKFVTGLTYGYLSSVVKTGSRVDSSATFNVGNGSITAGNFYLPGNAQRYKNRSHLLHVPVLFQYALFKTTPFYLEAGPGISYLLSSNVLLYNSSGRAYFSNTGAYNKMLLSFTTGAGVELNSQKQIPFRLGYRFTYGISSVTKESFGKQQLQSSMLYLAIPIKK